MTTTTKLQQNCSKTTTTKLWEKYDKTAAELRTTEKNCRKTTAELQQNCGKTTAELQLRQNYSRTTTLQENKGSTAEIQRTELQQICTAYIAGMWAGPRTESRTTAGKQTS